MAMKGPVCRSDRFHAWSLYEGREKGGGGGDNVAGGSGLSTRRSVTLTGATVVTTYISGIGGTRCSLLCVCILYPASVSCLDSDRLH